MGGPLSQGLRLGLTCDPIYAKVKAPEGAQVTHTTIYFNGGAEEDRTPDLRIANATLSQLSYGPTYETKIYPHWRERAEYEEQE